MIYLTWAVLLVLQNASFTMTSRARNSGSDLYHAFAAVFSNGFWILNMMFLFDPTRGLLAAADTLWARAGFIGIYVACTVFGSVVMAKFLRKYIERGKRRVGVYNEGEAGHTRRVGSYETAKKRTVEITTDEDGRIILIDPKGDG